MASCEECLEPSDDLQECGDAELCPDCARDYWDFEEYVSQVKDDYKASVR